ncbi:MAG: FHA domain-containing protein [Firmicutes bacterium]|nr:FHA domain-containing protein [Bacillota bacterium]
MKICKRCEDEYPDNAIECEVCGRLLSISDSEMCKTAETAENAEIAQTAEINDNPKITLRYVVNDETIEIPENGAIIGRNCNLSKIFENQWVSELHCKILVDKNKCSIVDLGSTNGTWIDSDKLPKNVATEIYDGKILRIANLKFVIGIKFPKVEKSQETGVQVETAVQYRWEIVCPKCDKHHEVADKHAKIEECDNCYDEIDAKEIANKSPIEVRIC